MVFTAKSLCNPSLLTFLISVNYGSISTDTSANGSDRGWIPIPELIRTDADVIITFLAQNRVTYADPVWDPWFMATTPDLFGGVHNTTTYLPDNAIRVLGCADQFQLCTQAHTKCTSLSNLDALLEASTTL